MVNDLRYNQGECKEQICIYINIKANKTYYSQMRRAGECSMSHTAIVTNCQEVET